MRRRPTSAWLLLGSLAFVAVSALFGGGALLRDPSGGRLGMSVDLLHDSGFSDYTIPGLVLFVVLGLVPLLALAGVWCRPRSRLLERANPVRSVHWSCTLSCAVGTALVVWIVVQLVLVGYASVLQPIYGLLGLGIVVLCFMPGLRRHLRAARPTTR